MVQDLTPYRNPIKIGSASMCHVPIQFMTRSRMNLDHLPLSRPARSPRLVLRLCSQHAWNFRGTDEAQCSSLAVARLGHQELGS